MSGGKKPVTPAIQAAHTEVLNRIQQVETSLQEIRALVTASPEALGHNNPPEHIHEPPLDASSLNELEGALATLKSQPPSPNDKGRQAKNANEVVKSKTQKLLEWLARHGDTFVDAAMKEGGKQLMKGAIVLLVAHLSGLTELIAAWIRLL
jgi:hypothetical protein